ncbi:hypothetical protein HHK36_000020 [Tetracentron sinense]|uniref:Uncharacterized protein n=1 Tax=Tetracentron sinense TaxID=13715 RepID=A0A835DTM5_TETSI|nr:hypothetical protein HHK36_000020 [Tetracentron sinense]
MAISSQPSPLFNLMLIVFCLSFWVSVAEIRFSEVRSDDRSIIPFNEFGFTHTGRLELNVSHISLSNPNPDLDLSQAGFFLCTRDSWIHVLQQIQDSEITCALQSDLVKLVYTFDRLKGAKSFDTLFTETDANQFTLVFANCLQQLQVSMDVRSAMYNLDGKSSSSSRRDYLSAGKTLLPRVYFLFFLIYFTMAGLWIYLLHKQRLTVFRIHFFMLAVLVLKALNLLCEAEDKSYIKRTGSAHGWDVLFYIFSFLKGITLFTLIVLIGTGWSFLKPYLQDKEKKVLMIVIPLQVVANIAQVVIDENGPYAQDWVTWKQVFLLVDVVCCCAVLFPIVWSIKNLREAARTDGKAAVNLMKLTLFRHYYIVVICYIYFTRVVVYALETITSYRYLWTSVVAAELATLAFYAFTGYKFRPEVHNPYFVIDDQEEEAAAEALKLEDESVDLGGPKEGPKEEYSCSVPEVHSRVKIVKLVIGAFKKQKEENRRDMAGVNIVCTVALAVFCTFHFCKSLCLWCFGYYFSFQGCLRIGYYQLAESRPLYEMAWTLMNLSSDVEDWKWMFVGMQRQQLTKESVV